jgi:SsrA-binding protein
VAGDVAIPSETWVRFRKGVVVRVKNRKAYRNYKIEEKWEAGVVLTGAEVKSVRSGRVKLDEGFVKLKEGEAWMVNVNIPVYEHAKVEGYDPGRSRKLLLHKKQLLKLKQMVERKGWGAVPVSCYSKKGLVKVEIGVGKGRKTWEKRERVKKRQARIETERELRGTLLR